MKRITVKVRICEGAHLLSSQAVRRPSTVARRTTSDAGEPARVCSRLAPVPLAALPLSQLTAPAPLWQEICAPNVHMLA